MFKKIDKNLIGFIIGTAILFFAFIFLIMCAQIGYGVRNQCQLAQGKYGGECVDALMAKVADASDNYGKNSAIWALGQLGDKKALSFLEQYDNGEPLPEREPWDKGISQYELRKALKLLRGGINLSALVRR